MQISGLHRPAPRLAHQQDGASSSSCSSSSSSRWPPRPGPCPQQSTRRRCCLHRLQSAQGDAPSDFLANVQRVAKKIQGSLPVIGLLSRLASPEGGFDETAYPEFCRKAYDTDDERFRIASLALEERHGRMARTRWTLLLLWMAKNGVGVVPSKDIMAAARRLRVSQDLEVEVDRFTAARDAVIKKYSMMERPEGKVLDQATVACDAIAVMCLGLKDGQGVAAEDQQLLADVLQYAFPSVDAQLAAVVAERPGRAGAYS